MADFSEVKRQAEVAVQSFRSDPGVGLVRLERLLRDHPQDGIVHLYYAECLEQQGRQEEAATHFDIAVARCWQHAWQSRARAGRLRVGAAAVPVSTPVVTETAACVPTAADVERARAAFLANERRSVVYDATEQLLAQALEPGSHLSTAVAVAALLQSWNFAYYNNSEQYLDAAHVSRIEQVLARRDAVLRAFRERSIESVTPADEPIVVALFGELEQVVKRVGAAKALHLWAADFFPLWDNPIAAAYGIDFHAPGSKAAEYWRFLLIAKAQVAAMPSVNGRTRLTGC